MVDAPAARLAPAIPSSDARGGSRSAPLARSAWAAAAAFGSYFCIYGLRMPFKAATFAGVPSPAFGLSFKAILVSTQVLGYCLSKFLGIRLIAGLPPQRRGIALLVLAAVAELALVAFGLVPQPWNVPLMFVNGLSLGMAFGLILGFLEGRRQTEAMIAGLCCSFVIADGVTKGVGVWFLDRAVGQMWMPAVTGAVFLAPLVVCVWALTRIPPPDAADVVARSHRPPMSRPDRRGFLRRYWPGLSMLALGYLLVTILRSLRGDFATEIWQGLGVTVHPSTFALTETVVATVTLALFAGLVFVLDNRRAFMAGIALSVAGFTLGLLSLVGLRVGSVGPFAFVVLVGVGLYLPYFAVHTTLFERMLAMTRERANIAFLMYLVDAVGYLAYVGVVLGEGFLHGSTVLTLFIRAAWLVMAGGIAALAGAGLYFARHPALRRSASLGSEHATVASAI
jgi:hypothetical protein